MKYKLNIIFGILGFLLVTAFFWLGGWDFNERGHVAVLWLYISCVLAVLGFGFPFTFIDKD